MIDALLGASAVAAVAISVFFLSFHAQTRDRFHLFFAAAFTCLAVNRVMLLALGDDRETNAAVYLLRRGLRADHRRGGRQEPGASHAAG